MKAPLTPAQARAVYNVLVEHAGATEAGRDAFVVVQANSLQPEFRFQGSLGFGGKFRRERLDDRWYVDAYPEDIKRDPTIQNRIDATNAALAALNTEVAT